MRKITLRLTDEEYATLEQRARNERRSVREMAEFLVVQPSPLTLISPYLQPSPTLIPPYIVTNKGATTICSSSSDAH